MVGVTDQSSTQEINNRTNNISSPNGQDSIGKNAPPKETTCLNYGEEDEMEIYGYERCTVGVYITWIFYILTCGLLRLVFHWYSHWLLYSTHRKCTLSNAQKVLIIENYLGNYKSYFVKDVKYLTSQQSSSNQIECVKDGKLKIRLENGTEKQQNQIRVIWCKKLCYVWDEDQLQFVKLIGLDRNIPNSELHKYEGIDEVEQLLKRTAYGPNTIQVPLQGIGTLLLLEVLNPFYIFQVFTIIVWLCEYYYYYTIAIIIMSVFGISSSIIQTRKNQENLHGTVQSFDKVTVCRGKNAETDEDILEEINASNLVPGDVIVIPSQGYTMQCDCALLRGGACIVNESMLTGESVPVTKTPLPNSSKMIYNVKVDSNHTLYCGTKVIQTRYYGNEPVKAVVIRTGYLTTKGQLIRSILYPPPADFKFDQDSYKFIGILAVISFLGVVYTIVFKSSRGITAGDIIIKALDLITIVIPPALPAAMTVGKLYALNRLKKKNIYCMNSRIINVSGSINCVCFDKTGTLTEDGLDMWGVIPVQTSYQLGDISDKRVLVAPLKTPAKDLNYENSLLQGMVTCHSVSIIDNVLSGDPLDVKMFESTGWHLEEQNGTIVVKSPALPDQHKISIIHQYQFSSTLQRMSVITMGENQQIVAYCKGSPEMVMSLSKPETVPANLLEDLKVYTQQGYRVIAMGKKKISEKVIDNIKTMERDDVERDLDFIGLIILENRLKPQTSGVIDILKRANIKIVMITGDNIETALSVARECGIIERRQNVVDVQAIAELEKEEPQIKYTLTESNNRENGSRLAVSNGKRDVESTKNINKTVYAMTGQTWELLRNKVPEELPNLARHGAVFARMSSDQKQQLVQELQTLGYYVAMCGDGANDCGALKAAHAGISLSDAESSVASPFTSKEANISCVPKVIREGRAALITSFGIFKFMVAYSLTEFTSAILLYSIDSNLTDLQFLFIDICLIVNFAFFFGKTRAFKGPLVNKVPETGLLSLEPLLSLTLQLASYIAFQVGAMLLLNSFSWYTPFVFNPTTGSYSCEENYAVFAVSLFQYIIMAIVFSRGEPYRRPFYTNYPFTGSIVIMVVICIYIIMYPAGWIMNALELILPPQDFRIIILGFAFANLCLAMIFEDFIVNYVVHNLRNRGTRHNLGHATSIPDHSICNSEKIGVDNVTFVDENGLGIQNTTTKF